MITTSGKIRPKRDDIERERLKRRTRKTLILSGKNIGHLTNSESKPPSQVASENLRKRFARKGEQAGNPLHRPNPDCFDCPKRPHCCKTTLDRECTEPCVVERCKVCGVAWKHRILRDAIWRCPRCRSD